MRISVALYSFADSPLLSMGRMRESEVRKVVVLPQISTCLIPPHPFPASVDGPEGYAKRVRISVALHSLVYFPLLLPTFRSGLTDASAVLFFFRMLDCSLHTDSSPFFIPSSPAERKRRGRRRLSCPGSNKDLPLRTNPVRYHGLLSCVSSRTNTRPTGRLKLISPSLSCR